jgi:NADPH:quinone reductase-like Zn-dependent oxidoreductase
MKAMRFHDYGAPLQLDEVPVPQPGAGQVQMKVNAVAVNPFDLKVAAGLFKDGMQLALPSTPGFEASGTVTALGPGVSGIALGSAIYAKVTAGYAQYALASTDKLAPKPAQLSDAEAAAVPVALETAWSTLFDLGKLERGQRALILGAAGSVGLVAVQLAKWKGAFVAGTASGENLDFVRSLGADAVVDYTKGSIEGALADIDLVLDTVGGESARQAFATMRRGGILISIIAPPPAELAEQRGVRAVARFNETDPLTIPKTAGLVAAGDVKTVVRATFPLAEANAAWALSRTGHGRGKVVLTVEQ